MTLPSRVREELRARLWAEADAVEWASLSTAAKTKYYENWTAHPEIGGVLIRYLDKGKIRVYIKDTILKTYGQLVLADEKRPLRVLKVDGALEIVERYTKPHGIRLSDGRIVGWGRADDWKSIILAMFERHYQSGARPFGVVFFNSSGRFDDAGVRAMVEDASKRLELERVVWLKR